MSRALADASPEKRLFISLITRDISLADAILDIIDNSINAALEPLAEDLKSADDYQSLLSNKRLKPKVHINVVVSAGKISVVDTAHGISFETAKAHVFKFGRDEDGGEDSDRLSVYGIGLKRAMFKCGNDVRIVSDHRSGGFELKLDVANWQKKRELPWTFEIVSRPAERSEPGTSVVITSLTEDVVRRISDGLFLQQLRDRIGRTYSFFIGRIVSISLNGTPVEQELFEISSNYSSAKFKVGDVSCNITAGIAVATAEAFRDRNAGWFVFCNGRAVLTADKSHVTGWGGGGLPIFQPKHRPFLGTVFFVSKNPESLPWTTTKSAVNEESNLWQEARRHMSSIGRVVVGFLDKRYTADGTEIKPADLQVASGSKVSVLTAATAKQRSFSPPVGPTARTTRIQYDAKIADIEKIAKHLRRSMGGSEVGRYTFNHFLKNEVGGGG